MNRPPEDGWVAGDPGKKEAIQAKNPKVQQMKESRDHERSDDVRTPDRGGKELARSENQGKAEFEEDHSDRRELTQSTTLSCALNDSGDPVPRGAQELL